MAHDKSLPPTDRDEQPELTPAKKTAPVFPCNQVLRDKLRVLRATSNVYSNTQLGNKLGYSPAVLSQYLSDTGCHYTGNIAILEKKIDDFLTALERRRASGIKTGPSKVADEMFSAFEYIRKCSDLGAIIAKSGEGKSRGIELIREKNPLVILIEVTEWACDKHSLMAAIWEGCAVDGWDASKGARFPYLIQKLRGSDRPFIIDDAHKLSNPALSLISTFQEKTKCPVALCGIPTLVAKMETDSQRFSRAGIKYALESGNEDPELLLHMVRSVAKGAVNGELDELIELCAQVARHQGCKRAVEKQLKLALELRHVDPNLEWPEAFRKAHTLLFRSYQLS